VARARFEEVDAVVLGFAAIRTSTGGGTEVRVVATDDCRQLASAGP
jgi:hypothetical protein